MLRETAERAETEKRRAEAQHATEVQRLQEVVASTQQLLARANEEREALVEELRESHTLRKENQSLRDLLDEYQATNTRQRAYSTNEQPATQPDSSGWGGGGEREREGENKEGRGEERGGEERGGERERRGTTKRGPCVFSHGVLTWV